MARGEESQIARAQRGRQTNPMTASDQAIDQAVARYMDRYLKQVLGDYTQLVEKVSVLNGDLGDVGKRAARLVMLQQLVSVVPAEPSCRQATATPTLDEYNALVADVHALYSGFAALRFLLSQQS